MKNLKRSLTFFFAGLFAMSLLVSCQKESVEEVAQIDKIEWIDEDASQQRVPDNGTTVCYIAHLSVDKDCDGVFDLGWNQATASANGCSVLVQQMVATAQANGWCYKEPSTNCGIYIGTCR